MISEIPVSSWSNHFAFDVASLGIADEYGSEHVYLSILQFVQGHDLGRFPFSSNIFHNAAYSIRGLVLQQQLACFFQLVASLLAGRVVKADHKIRLRCQKKAFFNFFPWGKKVA